MRARLILLSLFLPALVATTRGSDASLERYAVVEVAPVKISNYLGSITLDLPRFVRQGEVYRSTYTAKIFPYSFFNEAGRLEIPASDDSLQQFSRQQTFDFTGKAIRGDGVTRKILCRVTQIDATHGKMSVRIFLTRRFSLKFDTTYRLPPTPGAPVSSSGIR